MDAQRIGSRGLLCTFDDLLSSEYACLTNIYLIAGERHTFIIDTGLGSAWVEAALDEFHRRFEFRSPIILTTHHHWDHVWGHAAVPEAPVWATPLCRDFLARDGERILKELAACRRGSASIRLPDVLVESALDLAEEALTIFPSPGHTPDGLSVFDRRDKTLVAGDALEWPVPFIDPGPPMPDLETYIATLNRYLHLAPDVVIASHASPAGLELIAQNLSYLESLRDGTRYEPRGPNDERFDAYHKANLAALGR
ncbi:MAG: MBL fold metallo-hydrolase [Myxococcales bacterium]|nr:MAG: MBL fold metallo-hydrolase [Myxococcales bacterium]